MEQRSLKFPATQRGLMPAGHLPSHQERSGWFRAPAKVSLERRGTLFPTDLALLKPELWNGRTAGRTDEVTVKL